MASRSRRVTRLAMPAALVVLAVVLTGSVGLAKDVVVPPPPAEEINPAAGETSATIVLAGGCFWCTEVAMEQVRGVTDVVSGYAGGTASNAKYGPVSAGKTKHAECVQVTYDPSQITLGELFQAFFLIHDPTTADGQAPDFGPQYRPAIFYADDAQKTAAEAYLTQVREAGLYSQVATALEPLGEGFYVAEDYHQDYVVKNPRNAYVVRYALPKVVKLQEHLPELLTQN